MEVTTHLNAYRAGFRLPRLSALTRVATAGGWHSHWTGGGTDGIGEPNIASSVSYSAPQGAPLIDSDRCTPSPSCPRSFIVI